MKLSKQFPELGTMLMKQLLICPGEKRRKRGPLVNVATVELIYQLGKKQDSSYEDRYSARNVDWVKLALYYILIEACLDRGSLVELKPKV